MVISIDAAFHGNGRQRPTAKSGDRHGKEGVSVTEPSTYVRSQASNYSRASRCYPLSMERRPAMQQP